MRQVTRKGLITMAAAGGVLALGGSYAYADAGATGIASNSPGVASGNTVQLPLHVPVNACGNTVNVVGLLNPAGGNQCSNSSGGGTQGTGAQADGETSNSPGVASGNNIQAPIHLPVNACGNTVTAIGLGNAVAGNECGNGTTPGTETPDNPVTPVTPPVTPVTPPVTPVTPPVTPVTPPVTPVTPPVTPVTPPVTPVTPPVTPVTPPVTPVTPPVTPVTPPVTPVTPGQPTTPNVPNAPEPAAPNTPGTQTGNSPVTPDELAQTGSGPLDMLIPAGAGLLLAGAVLYRRGRVRA
ncbi:chaplin [Streptomyces maoxianensis]|uniref:Chaplin n=1 Tax=Streptomyces maoxianensis TaxID=1459942 RepID=A0ABV9G922_9ACTN